MDNLAYFQGYMNKIAAHPMDRLGGMLGQKFKYPTVETGEVDLSPEGIKGQVMRGMNPDMGTLAKHVGGRASDWIKANPDKAILLAGLIGGGAVGGAMGRKNYKSVPTPTGKPVLKGIAAGGAAAAGALAYKNRDKISEFLRNMKSKATGTIA